MSNTTTATTFRATQNFKISYYHTKRNTKIAKGETIEAGKNFRILNGTFFWVQKVGNEQTAQLTKPLPIGLIEEIWKQKLTIRKKSAILLPQQ